MIGNTPVATIPLRPSATLAQVIEHINRFVALTQRALSPIVGTFGSGDTTPSVAGSSVFLTANGIATSISMFDDPTDEQVIIVIAQDSNTTIVHSTALRTSTGANVALVNQHAYQFVYAARAWRQVEG